MLIYRPTALALLIALLVGPATYPAMGQGSTPYLNVQPIGDFIPLEVKLGYRMSPATEIVVGALWNDGSENQIDLFRLDANLNNVTVLETQSAVDSGQVFGLGDWCIGADADALPYIENFNVQVVRLDSLGDTVIVIGDSLSSQYTTTDCITLDNGDWIISAHNFDLKRIDYFRSTDQGLNWNLSFSFQPPSNNVIGPFEGGYRDTSDAVDNNIGTTYQIDNGLIQSALLDPNTGNPMGIVDIFSHPFDIGNGFLKECDGITYAGFASGLCNSGNDVWGGSINLITGSLDTMLLNNVDTGNTLGFQSVSVSAGVFGGNAQFHHFSNEHVVVPFDGVSWGTPFPVSSYPFQEEGGPVDSLTSKTNDRIYVAGLARGGNAMNLYLAVATLDPALIDIPQQEAAQVPIPFLSSWSLAVLTLLLAGAAWTARRQRMVE